MAAKVTAKDIYTQFSKQELLAMTVELGVDGKPHMSTRDLSGLLLKDLDENGIPEDLDAISDKLYELLFVAEYIDEDGNVLEGEEAEPEKEPVEQVTKVDEIPNWICFSYADPRDPACQKCRLYDRCWEARLGKRPECFGKLYDSAHPECQKCIEAVYCSKLLKGE